MGALSVRYNNPEYSDEFLNSVVGEVLKDNSLMSLATVQGGRSYINTAYYAYSDDFDLFFLSSPQTQHALNLKENPSVAVSIYDSHQEWNTRKKGLQLFGHCELASGKQLLSGGALYMRRFSGLRKWIEHVDDLLKNIIESKLYVIHVDAVKAFHEEKLGEDVFLNLHPAR